MTWSSDSDCDEHVDAMMTTSPLDSSSPVQQPSTPLQPRRRRQRARRRAHRLRAKNSGAGAEEEEQGQQQPVEAEAEDVWRGLQQQREAWPRRSSRPVVVAGEEEGSADAPALAAGEGGVGRARSLTDDDLEELKGCVDLGFGFIYHEIPELCGTLSALELCYSMSQRFLDEHQQLSKVEETPAMVAPASPAHPIATNWKISSPGDSPDEVKARQVLGAGGGVHRQALQLINRSTINHESFKNINMGRDKREAIVSLWSAQHQISAEKNREIAASETGPIVNSHKRSLPLRWSFIRFRSKQVVAK